MSKETDNTSKKIHEIAAPEQKPTLAKLEEKEAENA